MFINFCSINNKNNNFSIKNFNYFIISNSNVNTRSLLFFNSCTDNMALQHITSQTKYDRGVWTCTLWQDFAENITIIKIYLCDHEDHINNEISDEKQWKSTAVTLMYSRFQVHPPQWMVIPWSSLQCGSINNILNVNYIPKL